MDTFFSAVLGEILSRSISFLIDRYHQQQQDMEESLQRLQRVLLRIEATVEEADGRHITNQAMMLQLRMLRDAMCRGYYFFDNFRYRVAQMHILDEVGDHSLDLSHFNPLKRFCFYNRSRKNVCEALKQNELQKMLDHLEIIVSDMQEIVVLVSSYPRMSRQPYCSYLLMENCMFGRQAELEKVINFLLGPHHPVDSEGKSTLVEYVCLDERVRNYFSKIILCGADIIEDGDLVPVAEIGEIKHHNPATTERSLFIIELINDMDEKTWKRILHSMRGNHITHLIKIIITSRSNNIASFGTTEALQLDYLPKEVFWYFFKTMVFGSTNPEEKPKLASICMEIADLVNRSFMGTHFISDILRSNLNSQFWCKFLECFKYYISMHIRQLGEHPSEAYKSGRTCIWTPKNRCDATRTYAITYNPSQPNSANMRDQSMILARDVITGNIQLQGKIDILVWQSKIPPYYTYMVHCEALAQPLHTPPKRKRS